MSGKAKLRSSLGITAIFCGAALLVRQQRQTAEQNREITALRTQAEQAATLAQEKRTLSDQLKSATEAAELNARELARLRAEAGKIRKLEAENAHLKSNQEESTKATPVSTPDGLPYDGFFGPGSNTRMHNAMRWGYALTTYAQAREAKIPGNLQEISSFIGPEDFTAEQKAEIGRTADQFEVLYHGRLEDMTNPPPEGAILLREKEAWQTTSGEWARVYIYGNGHGTIHTDPTGRFESWEAPRIEKSDGQ
jgi:hypothetical protein